VRSGSTGLGEWHNEERTLAPDRAKAIGGATLREVVRVWLIVTCVCAGSEARGSYADIELVDHGTHDPCPVNGQPESRPSPNRVKA
jgi:hypothetical protein